MSTKSPLIKLPFSYAGQNLLQIALPMGGIGAGSICLNGHGGLQDFSIRNRPSTTACPPPGPHRPDAGFALLRVENSKPITRLLEGPLPTGKVYNQGIWTGAMDTNRGGYEGLPRFRRARFSAGFPYGKVELSDPAIPLSVEILGWNPFVPLDDVASGIPCAILEYHLRNTSRHPVDFQFSYHLSHLAIGALGREEGSRNQALPGRGVLFTNTEAEGSDSFGSASLTVIGHRPAIKAMWLRGGWFDAISALWQEIDSDKFASNDGSNGGGRDGRNGGSILVRGRIAAGETTIVPVVISWHFPNSSLRAYGWSDCVPPDFVPKPNSPSWRPFYVTRWKDAADVAAYVRTHFRRLRERTISFQNALFSSTLPTEVLDAVSANLAILKSPTLLRQENGNLWGWEGCCVDRGSCSGSCTHVWNYAQALPHLFPGLERTLREQELKRSMDDRGHVSFRSTLPDGPAPHHQHAAADGQLGGILKLYRDWQISGDTGWLRELYPLARRSLEYCIQAWDPGRRGALVEPHHNTYDIEFWGADGMCCSIYLGALSAMAEMARAVGKPDEAGTYGEIALRSARFMEEELFNGAYFEQKVQYEGLRDTSFIEKLGKGEDAPEMLKLLRREGPKYQYKTGCLSDGIIGAWMAGQYGVQTPLDQAKVKKSLRSIYRHNFRRSLRGHVNTQRTGYAMENEAGLLLCSWPRGGKPTLPFIYSDEVWTGVEYQVASHLISEGFVREGLNIVKAARSRYDGFVRNPWNEYECGSYYARAMASYALLPSLGGFRYSAVEKTLWFGPRLKLRPFTTFFSTATGYGSISLSKSALTVSMIEGKLDIRRVVLTYDGRERTIISKVISRPGSPARFSLKASRKKKSSFR